MQTQLPHTVRLIGGKYRGKQLTVLQAPGLRPTPDRVRESIFNLIGSKVEGAQVLDLFAGSGALGLEAISRGARSLVLVENNAENCDLLSAEIRHFKGEQIKLVQQDALTFLQQCSTQFDVVFLDPPYGAKLLEPALNLLNARALIKPSSILYVEMSSATRTIVPGFEIIREQTAGQVKFGLWRQSSFLF